MTSNFILNSLLSISLFITAQVIYYLSFPFISCGFCRFVPYNNSCIRGFILDENDIIIKNNFINSFRETRFWYIRLRMTNYFHIFELYK